MGMGRLMSNNKRDVLQRKSWRKHRLRKAEAVRRQGGQKQAEIADPHLVTAHILRKRRTSPRTNITLSGKKKRKLLKQIKHLQADKNRMEVEEGPKPKKQRKNTSASDSSEMIDEASTSKNKDSSPQDVEMTE